MSEGLGKIRSCIKGKLVAGKFDRFGCENERKQVMDLFKSTVETGESNSALLIGPRGVGKTTV